MDRTMPATTSLFGREVELQAIDDLLDHVRDSGGSLVVSGGPGVGKSALLGEASRRAQGRGMLVLTATGVPSEAELPFAGLHQLLLPILSRTSGLAASQRDALLAAFGLGDAAAPDMFPMAMAALDLLAASATDAPVLVVADDAHWLARSTCDVLAFVARRLEFEPILMIAAIRDGFESPLTDAGLPVMDLAALPEPVAAALLDSRTPGLPASVRARLLEEAAGNPLALTELPATLTQLGSGARLPAWLPLTTRLERAFAARVADLPAATRTALLVTALNDSSLLSEVLAAASLLAGAVLSVDVLAPAVDARITEISDAELRFRHPLMRAAIRQDASVSQRLAAHAALADVLRTQPERRVWHRAASVIGPDEQLASEFEETAARAQRRGATLAAVCALQRAVTLSETRRRVGWLLRAAELAFELGRRDLVQVLLDGAEPLDLRPSEQARVAWIRESFADGIPGDAAMARSLTAIADRVGADGDRDLALKLLYGAAVRCWWDDPGPATRGQIVAAAERLDVDTEDPRLVVILALAAPVERGGRTAGRHRRDGRRSVRYRRGISRGRGRRATRPGPAWPPRARSRPSVVERGAARRPGHGHPGRRGRTAASAGNQSAYGHGDGAGRSGAAGRAARGPGRGRITGRAGRADQPADRRERRARRGAARSRPRRSRRRPPG
jgi:hypothetical protein